MKTTAKRLRISAGGLTRKKFVFCFVVMEEMCLLISPSMPQVPAYLYRPLPALTWIVDGQGC